MLKLPYMMQLHPFDLKLYHFEDQEQKIKNKILNLDYNLMIPKSLIDILLNHHATEKYYQQKLKYSKKIRLLKFFEFFYITESTCGTSVTTVGDEIKIP